MHRSLRAAAVAANVLVASPASAVSYAESFDVDPTASWTVNDPGLSDTLADFHYDYSEIGVPAAPGGATTFGLKLTANNSGNVFSGFSVSPTGQSFSGDYTISFDLWQNYAGPLGPGGSGTTQLSLFGLGTAGDVAVWPGSDPKESIAFGVTLDGGSQIDYRAYDSGHLAGRSFANGGDEIFAADPDLVVGNRQGGENPYYAGFGGASAPAAQLVLFPGQTGVTDAGEIAFAWRHVVIDVSGALVTWSIDGLEIAALDATGLTLGGGNLLFGHSDANTTSSSDPNDTLLNVTLIDNIRVVPEPGALALCLAGLGWGTLLRSAAARAHHRTD
jgi:hypothetical protein